MLNPQPRPTKRSTDMTTLLVTTLVLLSGVAVIVVSAVQLTMYYLAQRETIALRQALVAREAAAEVENFIDQIFTLLASSSTLTSSDDDRGQTLERLLRLQPALRQVTLLDKTGQELIKQSRQVVFEPADLTNQGQSEAFLAGQEGRRYIGPVYFDEADGGLWVTMAVPVTTFADDFDGVLVAEVDLSFVRDLVAGLEVGQTGIAYMVDDQGRLIAFREMGSDRAGQNLGRLPLVAAFLDQQHLPPFKPTTGMLGLPAVGGYIMLDFPAWAVFTELPTAEVYGPIRFGLALAFGLVVLTALMAVWIGVYLARRLAAPLHNLTRTVSRMAEGRFNQTIPLVGPTEMQQLAAAFNRMTLQTRELVQSLEDRVSVRTQRLETIAAISRRLSSILSLDDLLTEVVERLQTSFNFYHAHVYLLDEQQLIVNAGTGSAGAHMKAARHSISLHAPASLVARAARTGQVVWADDVRQQADWLPNELLPNTHAEMAVPILLGEQVVGVLDVQQDTVGALDESDASLLRSLANHLAVAIRNDRLLAQVETALAEARLTQSLYLRQTWQPAGLSVTSGQSLYQSIGQTPLSEEIVAGLEQTAEQQSGPAIVAIPDGGDGLEKADRDQQALIAPIKLYGYTIGTMQFHQVDGVRPWHETEQALIEVIAAQVAQAAENIRLFEEMRERSSREQTVREITDKLRAAPNLDALLATAARELGQRLQVHQAVMELGIE